MNKVSVIAACLLIGLCSVSAPEAAPTAVDTTVADFEADLNAVFMITPLPECGDYCDTPGEERGCVYRSGSSAKRVPCACSGGVWVCY